MKTILFVLLACMVSAVSFAAITDTKEYRLNNYMGAVAYEAKLGTELREVKKVAKIVFDYSLKDSTGTLNSDSVGSLTASNGVHSAKVPVIIPDNAIVTRAWYDVINTFTSATDAAAIKISLQTSGDIVASTAISAGGNVWDAGLHNAILDDVNDPAHFIKMTANRKAVFTVANEALTAGKLVLFLEYVVSE